MPTKWQKRKLPISRCYMCVTVKFFSLFCVSAYFKTEKPDLDEQRKNRKMKRRMDFLWWLKKRKTLLCFCPQAPPFNYNEKSLECYLPPCPTHPLAHTPPTPPILTDCVWKGLEIKTDLCQVLTSLSPFFANWSSFICISLSSCCIAF